MGKLIYVFTAIAAGFFNGFQAPINAALSRFTGVVESSCISFSVGALILFAVSMVLGKGSLLKVLSAPPHLWLGGVVGALLVTTMLYVVTRIGTAVMISSVIMGQMMAALLIDQIGFLGVPKSPLVWSRVAGLLLLLAGTRMMMMK